MTDQNSEPPGLPEHLVTLAGAVRRLGSATVRHDVDETLAAELVAELAALAERVEAAPAGSVKERVHHQNRVAFFLEAGRWPEPPPSGSQLEFDPVSIVGGELNPFGIGAVYYRDGDEAVGRVTIGPCFEGPPGRVHGGVISAIFDEVLGSVFRATGTASAFTGELAVRFEQPAALGVPLEFRAWRVDTKGRRQFLEGEASGPDGRFATATATFIDMTPEQIQALRS